MVIDITGCAHLFGGEGALAADLTGRLRAAGFAARAAIAATPTAAWGIVRFADAEERRRERLDGLPLAALRLQAETVEALHALGLRRIGDLHAMPRAGLAARFGEKLLQRYDQAFGRLDEPISPRRPVPAFRERLSFAEPIATPESIAGALRHLLRRLCAGLEAAGQGARRLRLDAHCIDQRVDDEPQGLTLGTSRPARDPAVLARLFAPLLERIEPGPGLETLTLAATETEPLGAIQIGMDGEGADGGLVELVDRLVLRLGDRAVLRLVPRESWLPERCVAPLPPGQPVPAPKPWPAGRPRPLRLLTPPEPVEAIAPLPDDPPLQFLWARRAPSCPPGRWAGADRMRMVAPGRGRWGSPSAIIIAWRMATAAASGCSAPGCTGRGKTRAGSCTGSWGEGLFTPSLTLPAFRGRGDCRCTSCKAPASSIAEGGGGMGGGYTG